MLTGTGLAQPSTGIGLNIASSGIRIVPIGSMCTTGLSDTRPSCRAVGSPSLSDVQACAASWIVSDTIRMTNEIATESGSSDGFTRCHGGPEGPRDGQGYGNWPDRSRLDDRSRVRGEMG